MTYKEQLAHPKWQIKRLKILERDNLTCQICGDTETTLHIHHKAYDKTYQTKAWEYPDSNYMTLCSDCHGELSIHIDLYETDKEFDVMKIIDGNEKIVVIYTKGRIKFRSKNNPFCMSERNSIKIVQFTINNWLKNG